MIRTRGLRVVYPGGHVALDGVDLDIGPGVFGLLGPNGAGKSTLQRVLATLLLPSAGEVLVAGMPLPADADAVRFRIGYLPQEFNLFPKLTCAECLDYLALLKGLDHRAARRAEVEAALAAVHLEAVATRRVGAISGGMRQRLGIAQTLLGAPDVLILDEPTASLDPEERSRLWNLLGGLAASRTVLLSTHQVADVAALCARLAVLATGRVRFVGTPAALMALAHGRVWELAFDSGQSAPADWHVVATRAEGARLILRVLAEAAPDPAAVPTDIVGVLPARRYVAAGRTLAALLAATALVLLCPLLAGIAAVVRGHDPLPAFPLLGLYLAAALPAAWVGAGAGLLAGTVVRDPRLALLAVFGGGAAAIAASGLLQPTGPDAWSGTSNAVLRRRKISTLSPGAGSDAVVPLRMGFMRRDLGVDKLLIGRLDAG